MVNWTGHALAQLRAIHDYIAQDSPLYAKRITEALVQQSLALERLPRLGRKVPELDEESVRELSLYTYRILYELKADRVEVLAVIHKRQNLAPEEIPREP